MSNRRRNENAGDYANEIFDSYNAWSAGLGTYSVQAVYALIAANWAVHTNASGILGNVFAKFSIIVAVVFLGLNILATGLISRLCNKRVEHSEDCDRWDREFKETQDIPEGTTGKRKKELKAWPYTSLIQNVGSFIRILKIWAPVLAGVLFILSLFFSFSE